MASAPLDAGPASPPEGPPDGVAAPVPAPVEDSPPPVHPSLLDAARTPHTLQTLLAALAAWATTVAPAAFARGAPALAGAVAVLAIGAGLAGPLVAASRRRVGRHVGVSAYLGLATLTWLLAGTALHPARLDPLRAAIGAVAWGAFALSWSDPWRFEQTQAADPSAPQLQARAALPAQAVPVAAVGVLSALACLFLAWRIRDPGRAILGQAAAIACAVALVTAAATVATSRGKRAPAGSRRLGKSVVRPLALLAIVGIGGAIVLALR